MLINHQEDAWYAKHPSAELAYEYGEYHLNSTLHPLSYNIDRAEHFFQLAVQQDPHLPYIYHELAHVAFLTDDLPVALAYIDVQIDEQGDKTPSSYYLRGLIEGFMGNYSDAEKDYAHYLQYDPIDWAAVNDYAWVLLKDNKPASADVAIEAVLKYFPSNAWLLNSDAIALSELGDATTARERIDAASQAVLSLSSATWSRAYPGNDPGIADQGLTAFKSAVEKNMHTLDSGERIPAVQ